MNITDIDPAKHIVLLANIKNSTAVHIYTIGNQEFVLGDYVTMIECAADELLFIRLKTTVYDTVTDLVTSDRLTDKT